MEGKKSPWVSRKQAAEILEVSVSSLAAWAASEEPKGPPFWQPLGIKGSRVRYHREHLERWRNTGEPPLGRQTVPLTTAPAEVQRLSAALRMKLPVDSVDPSEYMSAEERARMKAERAEKRRLSKLNPKPKKPPKERPDWAQAEADAAVMLLRTKTAD